MPIYRLLKCFAGGAGCGMSGFLCNPCDVVFRGESEGSKIKVKMGTESDGVWEPKGALICTW